MEAIIESYRKKICDELYRFIYDGEHVDDKLRDFQTKFKLLDELEKLFEEQEEKK